VAASLAVFVLVAVEHTKTIRPSTLTSLYLLFAILAQGTELRTLLLRRYVPLAAKILAASVINKSIILLFESQRKERILKLGIAYSPEESSGIFNRIVLWWLNFLLLKGYRSILKQEDLYPLNEELRPAQLRDRMVDCWEKSKRLS
jgi:ATP-binding cassette subfamily C (CFTR/MRP) protein 1